MKRSPVLIALFVAVAVLLLGAPVAAMFCTCASAGRACPMGVGASASDAAPMPGLAVEMTCCRGAEQAATAPVSVALVASQTALETQAVARVVDAPVPVAPTEVVGAVAEREQGVRRHAIGVFTLHSVYLI